MVLEKADFSVLKTFREISQQKHIGIALTRVIRLYEKVEFIRYDVGVKCEHEVWFFEKKITM